MRRTGSGMYRVASWSATVVLLAAACQDPAGPGKGDGGGSTATLSGTVRVAGTGQLVDGAKITLGAKHVITDANGHFELTSVSVGSATVRAERAGFLPVEAAVTLTAGSNTHDFTLSAQEIFVTGGDAAYVPAGVGPLRGVIIALGGPVTSGFVTGNRIAPIGKDELEASLQGLGAGLRAVARSARVALIGRTATGLVDNASSDGLLLELLRNASVLSGHPELSDAPVVLFGLSNGSREAGGFVSRQSNRTIGLLLRVPVDAPSLSSASALAVPTFVMQGETDVVVDNLGVKSVFIANRSRGGLWSLAVEPDVGHSVATDVGNGAVITWISAALSLRLPPTAGSPLIPLTESTGWLGDQATREIASWAAYTGDRTTASWLLSQTTATSWQQLGSPTSGGPELPARALAESRR
jgi:hypothetical protein